ncbi:MAG: GGDEF domain-containing protein [Planctomycetota bacterium]
MNSISAPPAVDRIISCESMPSPPTVAARLLELVNQPDATMDEIARVIGADPKLSTSLIEYCNSPMMAGSRTVSSLQQAVTIMGMRTLRLLSLSFSVMRTRGEDGFPYQDFWKRSLATAIAAKELASLVQNDPDESFLLGLVFDIGLLGIGCVYSQEIERAFPEQDVLAVLTTEKERDLCETDRYEVGYHLLENWSFPSDMTEVVRDFLNSESPKQRLIDVAQQTARLLLHPDTSNERIRGLRKSACEKLGLEESGFNDHLNSIIAQWKEYESLFKFDALPFESVGDLEKRARETMMKISLGLDQTIKAMSEEQAELRQMAMIDGLTRLKNRAAFDSEANMLTHQYRRRETSFALIVIDIDHFKSINDRFGHSAGDTVLKAVAECLQTQCRQYDPIYRFGGEEFVVLVGDCDYESAVSVTERLRRAVEVKEVDVEGRKLQVTASLGICWVARGQHDQLIDVFNRADVAMYEAKEMGRNTCVYSVIPSDADGNAAESPRIAPVVLSSC